MVSWRVGILLPVSSNPDAVGIGFQDLLRYLKGLDSLELRVDGEMFNIELEGINAGSLGVSPNFQTEWMACGFRMESRTAERLVQVYYYWMDNIFRTTDLH